MAFPRLGTILIQFASLNDITQTKKNKPIKKEIKSDCFGEIVSYNILTKLINNRLYLNIFCNNIRDLVGA